MSNRNHTRPRFVAATMSLYPDCAKLLGLSLARVMLLAREGNIPGLINRAGTYRVDRAVFMASLASKNAPPARAATWPPQIEYRSLAPMERRFSSSVPRTARAAGSQRRVLSGLAARFGVLSEDLGGFREKLSRGCFSKSLAGKRDFRMLADHDSAKILGSRSNNTLRLWEDEIGLRFECTLPDTTVASDVFELCSRGDLRECSFGFVCLDEAWSNEADPADRKRKVPVREVRTADLLEASIVTWPAYSDGATNVTASLVAAAGAGTGRSLFPAGLPIEVRARAPKLVAAMESDPESENLRDYARIVLARVHSEDMNAEINRRR